MSDAQHGIVLLPIGNKLPKAKPPDASGTTSAITRDYTVSPEKRPSLRLAVRVCFGFAGYRSITNWTPIAFFSFSAPASVTCVLLSHSADAFDAGLLVLDYIQRIAPPGEHGDKRGSVDATMNYLRQFADAGVAVIVVAAVSRTKDKQGRSSYSGDGLNLASFRESSELEFGADDAFILVPDPKADDLVTLRHLKARHTEPRDLVLTFDRRRQNFTPAATVAKTPQPDAGKLQSALAELWTSTEPARDDTEGDGE